jgi:hypothetical protein
MGGTSHVPYSVFSNDTTTEVNDWTAANRSGSRSTRTKTDELADAPARLRSLMKSGEVYPESVYLARWNEKKDRVEVLIGSRKCLHSEPPARANVSADLEMQF